MAEVAARTAYRSIDTAISQYGNSILIAKKVAASKRAKIAHPSVSQEVLDEFIDHLGGNNLDLSPLQVQLFAFIRLNSTSTANVEGARTRGDARK